MNALKSSRQEAIAQIIRSGGIGSQEELAERLAGLGFTATQATISRDLEQLGAIKVRKSGQSSYALPEGGAPVTGDPLMQLVFRDWVQEIAVAGNLVVIKTPPGSAHLVGVSLDQGSLADVVGTICGDDTIFVATPGSEAAHSLREKLAELAGI